MNESMNLNKEEVSLLGVWNVRLLMLVVLLVVCLGCVSQARCQEQPEKTPATNLEKQDTLPKVRPATSLDQAIVNQGNELLAARELIAAQQETLAAYKELYQNETKITADLKGLIKEKDLQLAAKDEQLKQKDAIIAQKDDKNREQAKEISTLTIENAKLKERASTKNDIKKIGAGAILGFLLKALFF